MRFPSGSPLAVAALLGAARLGLRRQRRPDRDRAQPRHASCAPTSSPGLHFKCAAGRERARVRPPPRSARRRPGALPHRREEGRQRRLLRDRRIDDVRAFYRATGGDERRADAAPGADHQATRCATRSTRAPCSRWCPATAPTSSASQLDSHQRRRRDARHRDRRHAHQAHRPAAPTAKSSATVYNRMRAAAPAGRQPAARRRRGAGAHSIRAEADRDQAGAAWPKPSATRRSCAAKAMPKPPASTREAANRGPGVLRLPAQPGGLPRRRSPTARRVIVLDTDDPFLQYMNELTLNPAVPWRASLSPPETRSLHGRMGSSSGVIASCGHNLAKAADGATPRKARIIQSRRAFSGFPC